MFFAAARAASEPIHHCLDWFGASQAVARQWLKAGYSAVSFDIKLNHEHDMVSESGRKNLLTIAAQLHSHAAVICAPPCSLFSPACASVHQRNWFRPEGNPTVFLVRLAQQILHNFATLLRVILSAAPTLSVIVEQPSGSWCYKQWFMEILIEDFDLLP
ncbi:Putative rhamnose biosynthetic enzyme 1, partial [Durusdinium trenchii]